MEEIWNLDGVRVWACALKFVGNTEVWIQGLATDAREARLIKWYAKPMPRAGYIVNLEGARYVREVQGATLNLGLEVASAVRHG